MSNNAPLSVLMENARGKLIQSFNQVIDETRLPAYLYEGMLCELLAEIRNRKNLELISDINAMESENDGTEEEKDNENFEARKKNPQGRRKDE